MREWIEEEPKKYASDDPNLTYQGKRITTPEWDEWEKQDPFYDHTFYLIYDDGTELSLMNDNNNDINLKRKPVYISIRGPEEYSDSLGMSETSWVPKEYRDLSHYQLRLQFWNSYSEDIREQEYRYDNRIQQLFKTEGAGSTMTQIEVDYADTLRV